MTDDPYLDPNIIGTWEWEQSSGGISGQTIHSDSVSYTQFLEIESSGKAVWYLDGEEVSEFKVGLGDIYEYDGLFVMVPVDTATGDPKEDGIKIVIEEVNTIRMILQEECADCYSHLFLSYE